MSDYASRMLAGCWWMLAGCWQMLVDAVFEILMMPEVPAGRLGDYARKLC